MLKLPFLFVLIFIVFYVILEKFNSTNSIADDITKYYDSELQQSFKRVWQKYKKSYEHAIAEALKRNVDSLAMNLYTRTSDSRFLIAGYLFDEKSVSFEVEGMTLREMPRLVTPVVTLAPASHLLRLEATLTTMIIDSNSRPVKDQDLRLFGRKHLKNGSFTIIAEDCRLSGFAITALVGKSINIGHKQFLIKDCKFSVEITRDLSLPPVIKSNFDKASAKRIEKLLTWAYLGELDSKLKSALYSLVNTSEIFGDQLNQFKSQQQKLFMRTKEFMIELCQDINKRTLASGKGQQKMDIHDTGVGPSYAMLYGLDTLYAAGDGGSFQASAPSVAEAMRFQNMTIRSVLKGPTSSDMDTNDFAAKLTDVTVNVILNLKKDGSSSPSKLEFAGWRAIEFSRPEKKSGTEGRNWIEGKVMRQLMDKLEKQTTAHLSTMLQVNYDKLRYCSNCFICCIGRK